MPGASTERLWETEPDRKTALAEVLEVQGGAFRLDRSLFRPKSRAYRHPQRADSGTVWIQGGDKHELASVFERSGDVWHRLDGAVPSRGDRLQCHLDQDQRDLDSRAHTGMHLLLAATTQLADPTLVADPEVKGGGRFRIDARGWELSGDVLAEAVGRVRGWIEDDRPVEISHAPRDVAEDKLDPQPFEEAGPYPGPDTTLRTVTVEGACAFPCDGTHVRRTGEVEDVLLRQADPRGEGIWMLVGEVPKPGRY